MTDSVKLKQRIRDSGFRIAFIAEKLGITYSGFSNKINNKTDFKAREIITLCDLLNINADEREAIFFAPNVDKMSTK